MRLKRQSVPRVPDLSARLDPALVPEWMDEACAYEDFRACVRDIAATTLLTGAYSPTLRFVRESVAGWPVNRPVHIVDVGCGGGDMLRRLAQWAAREKREVRLTGIDLNPHATRASRELSVGHVHAGGIRWITGDVFECTATQDADLVLSSLVTHHMQDIDIVRFLAWMEKTAHVGWFLSDLLRSERSYRLFGPLSRWMHWHRFVQHDGLVSIRRAFVEGDWAALLAEAAIPKGSATVRRCAIGRLCVSRLRE